MTIRDRFDQRYYDHFYGSARKAADRRSDERLIDFVCAYLEYLEQPVRSVVDIGCGLGIWRDGIARHFPKARYTGVEISEYLCEKYGWTHGSVIDFRAKRPFDLVICKDMLQYVPTEQCKLAITNLAKLSRGGALYLSVMTTEDWRHNCDRAHTDSAVYKRSASWYRRILRSRFTNVGGGVFLSARSAAMPWELETLRR